LIPLSSRKNISRKPVELRDLLGIELLPYGMSNIKQVKSLYLPCIYGSVIHGRASGVPAADPGTAGTITRWKAR